MKSYNYGRWKVPQKIIYVIFAEDSNVLMTTISSSSQDQAVSCLIY